MRSYHGAIYTRFHIGGYACARISGGELGGTWRCLKGNRGFRFGFGD